VIIPEVEADGHVDDSPDHVDAVVVEQAWFLELESFKEALVVFVEVNLLSFKHEHVSSRLLVQSPEHHNWKNDAGEVEEVAEKHCELVTIVKIAIRTPVLCHQEQVVVLSIDQGPDQQVNVSLEHEQDHDRADLLDFDKVIKSANSVVGCATSQNEDWELWVHYRHYCQDHRAQSHKVYSVNANPCERLSWWLSCSPLEVEHASIVDHVHWDGVECGYLNKGLQVERDLARVLNIHDWQVGNILLTVDEAPEGTESSVESVGQQELSYHDNGRDDLCWNRSCF